MSDYLQLTFDMTVLKCPFCGEELEVIDNMNFITSICPHCFTTVFEELNGKIHTIKNGIMSDGYNSSLDIFIKQLAAHGMAIKNEWADLDDIRLDMFLGMSIYNQSIQEHFLPMMDSFNLKQPCIYWDGYEKYLEMSKEIYKDIKLNNQ
ncbi:hypothetical protein [Clostridium sp. 3-3]|uniref:hypothetical protein n=1 Tax=Clostridium sp. 3-3 TaxID=2070757 RepID=UPI000CDA93EB|nr:hypothetical protein [Clostridium sp. 3-3]POO87893.1 hypothetical protein C1H59_03765 [Clostridium sp. 3-3]